MNYLEITAAVKDYSLRDDAPVDLFIKLFESDIAPLLIHYLAETTVTINIVNGRATLPADFVKSRAIIVDGVVANPVGIFTSEVFPDTVNYYQTGNQLVFTSGYAVSPLKVTIVYYGRIPALTSTATTNWLSLNFPNIYIFGVLSKLYRWATDADAEASAKGSLVESLQSLSESQKNYTKVSNPISREVTVW